MDPKAYSYSRDGKSKMVKGYFTMGFNVETEACTTNVVDDLKGIEAYFTVKLVQTLETDSSMEILGRPMGTNQSTVK